VIATMASVTEGVIPRSKIKSYAEDDLGLVGDEIEFFISVIRSIENKWSSRSTTNDPELTEQATGGDAAGVKRIVSGLANKRVPKKPRVRHPR
jgi:hypothetical protein